MNEQSIAHHQFFGEILNRVPEFTARYREHTLQGAEDGSTRLLCELADFLVEAYLQSASPVAQHQGVSDLALRILGALEDAAGNPDYRFDVKFAQTILPRILAHETAGERVCARMGPRLQMLKQAAER